MNRSIYFLSLGINVLSVLDKTGYLKDSQAQVSNQVKNDDVLLISFYLELPDPRLLDFKLYAVASKCTCRLVYFAMGAIW